MRQCEHCGYKYLLDNQQYCEKCKNSFISVPIVANMQTTLLPGQPPAHREKRRYRSFIPGLGAFVPFRHDSHKGEGCAPGCLVSVMLVALLMLGGFLFSHPGQPSSSPASATNLSVKGPIVPGKSAYIHGSNFPPNSTVEITLDGSPSASHTTEELASIGTIFMQEKQVHSARHTVIVRGDGIFNTTISVPRSWLPGSQHTIQAIVQDARGATVSINVKTQLPSSIPAVLPTPAATGVPIVTPPTLLASPTPTTQVLIPSPTPTTQVSIPSPTISSISPTNGSTLGGHPVTLIGSGFTGAGNVSFGSIATSDFTVDSDTQITVNRSPTGSGTVDVTVTTPSGTSATSSADQFTYNPPPVISAINPATGPKAGGTSITLTGSGFTGVSTVSFGSIATSDFTVDSDTQITVNSSPPGSGTVDVSVATLNGASATSGADQFVYDARPVVSGISPASGPQGILITLTGSGFTGASTVSFGATETIYVTVVSDTQLTAYSPSGSGTVDVTVTTPNGTSAASSADQFTYSSPPVVLGISPTSGPTSGNQLVTLTGSGFTGASTVSFGAAAISDFTVDSDTQITVNSSPPGSGTVDVTVTTPDGTSATSSADQFTYYVPPVVTGISPTGGTESGGIIVILTGSGFTGASTVSFGSTATSDFTVNKEGTQITVHHNPSGGNEIVDVTVITPGGISATTSNDKFRYAPGIH